MPRIRFTENLRRHVDCGARDVGGGTVREALEAYFTGNEAARSYVVDDQGALRRHRMIFVDGAPIADRRGLSDPIRSDAEILVLQALSGG